MDRLTSMAVLYVMCVMVDGEVTKDECNECCKCLCEYNGVEPDVALSAWGEAGKAVADCTDWVSLMETCCSNLGEFNDEMKAAVVADLCRIATADGTVHRHEGVHVTAVASELGVDFEA